METKEKTKRNSKKLNFPKEAIGMYETSWYIQPYSLFYLINNVMPTRLQFSNIDKDKLMDIVLKDFKLKEEDLIISKSFDFDAGKYRLNSVLIPIKKDFFIFFNPGKTGSPGVELILAPTTPKSLINRIEEVVKSCYTQTSHLSKIFLLQKHHSHYDLNPFEIKDSEVNIQKHYNDDFEEVNTVIKTRLNNENDKGLVLLHGKPGTGKTSYIRYLTSQINKRMIFLSPEMMGIISSPDFIGVLSEYPNSVIIIEDAENVIEERKGGGSSAISNLLNLTDGLLADCLKIQLICSFNTDVSRIDKALLRKGRLIAKYEFKELEQTKAQELSNSIGFKTILKNNTSIAEIFGQEEKEFITKNETKIGFSINEMHLA